MATPGSDAIAEVSKVFGQLADEGGAASDSFFALNNILKNNLNRGFLRFSKNLTDINKALTLQTKALRDSAKAVSKTFTPVRQSRPRVREGTDRTQTPKQTNAQNTQQVKNVQNLNDSFDDINETIRGSLINVIDELSIKISNVLPMFQMLSTGLSTFTNILSASKLQSAADALKPKSGAFGESASQKAKREAAEKKADEAKYKTPAERIGKVKSNAQKGLNKINDKIKEQEKYINGIKGEQKKLADEYRKVLKGVGTMGKTPRELKNLFDNLQTRLEQPKKYLARLQTSKSGIETALPKQEAQAGATTVADVIMKLKGGASDFSSNVVKYVSNLKIPAMLLTRSFAIAAGVATGFALVLGLAVKKLYDFGQNAVPQMAEFLITPIKEFHDIITGPLKRSFDTLTGFVAKLNPAYAEMASRALDDLSAIIGRIVLPIFITMVNLLKIFNNALFNNSKLFTDVIKEFSKQLGDIGIVVMSEFFNLLTALVPVLGLLTESFKKVGPKISGLAKKLGDVFMKHLPTVMKVIDSLANIIEMYLNMKLQEFANTAALAAHAAQNNARAMELFGKETMTLSMLFNNLGYFVSEFMLQLEGAIIELMGYISWFIGKKGDDNRLGKIVEDVQKNPLDALERGNIPLLENIQLEVAAGDDEEWEKLNIGEKAGAATRKWIAGLFGAEDMPWVQNKKKIKEEQPEAGGGEFEGDFGGVDIGGEDGLKEGFAAKGAQFQEIGELGKNLMQAAFGGGESVDEQQLDQLKQMNEKFQAMIDGQNQFNGMVPQQGVR